MKRAHILLSLALAVVWLGSGVGLAAGSQAAGPGQVPTGLSPSEWQRIQAQVAKLTAADGAQEDEFGHSVSISGDTAVVGAPWGNVGSNFHEGAAYVYSLWMAEHTIYLPLINRNYGPP
jgi:hypothetical protein